MSDKCNGKSTGAIKKTVTPKPKKQKQKLTKEEQEATNEMLTLISTLQSERIDSQRAELRPVSKTKPRRPFPGLLSHGSIKEPKSDDFLDMIEKIQGTRLEDQRTELPAKKPKEKKKTLPDDDFFAQIMRAQAGRMEDQRASIPLKEKKDQNKPTNSKK